MSFVIPSRYKNENLPKPNDPNVIIHKTADEYVAVIRYGGYSSDKDLKFYSEKLTDILKRKAYPLKGMPDFWYTIRHSKSST